LDLPDNEAGALAGSDRLVTCARILLREDVYHWHSKVMLKVPGSPGQWEWHQDYGYWYDNGCLYPRMFSAMVVLDEATRENGCLKVLEGSHLLGRLDHGLVGEQQGADPARVRHLESVLPVRYLEARPGSVIFFHCNTLHSSEPNLSQGPRRAMITAYNALSNAPVGSMGHGPVRELVTSAAPA
jgi:ectoine hydroxylase-related dioxygenase (phytanoyl-CoA dioxygenase family)